MILRGIVACAWLIAGSVVHRGEPVGAAAATPLRRSAQQPREAPYREVRYRAAPYRAANDTTTISLLEFLRMVRAGHPDIRTARLALERADASLRVARSAFDPSLYASIKSKRFDGTPYYSYASSTLSIPTPLGFNLDFGYDRTAGQYFANDRRTPTAGLFSAGLSFAVGSRLLIDERRTARRVAEDGLDIAAAEYELAVTKTLLESAKDYAKWYEAFEKVAIANRGVALAVQRLAFTRSRVLQGEAAPIDTLEATLEYERRTVTRLESLQAERAARIGVALDLWDGRGRPQELPADSRPQAIDADGAVSVAAVTDSASGVTYLAQFSPPRVDSIVRTHPARRRDEARLSQSAANASLASVQRIPLPTIDASLLSAARDGARVGSFDTEDDFTTSASLKVPVFLRAERAKAVSSDAARAQSLISLAKTERSLAAAVSIAAGDADIAAQSARLQRVLVAGQQVLSAGEQRRFEAGESTLFLVITRERALLDELQRLASIEARRITAWAELANAQARWPLDE